MKMGVSVSCVYSCQQGPLVYLAADLMISSELILKLNFNYILKLKTHFNNRSVHIYYFEIRVESLLWVNLLGPTILGNHWLVGIIIVLAQVT